MLNKLLPKLTKHKVADRQRVRHIIKKENNNAITVGGHHCIDFSSNDYLGLTKHPAIIDALMTGGKKYGLGSGASPMISGYSLAHQETELQFAKWLGVDRAILFNSGYCANISIISSLCHHHHTVFSDKLCHASLLDGITLSRAQHKRYRHNDLVHFRKIAAEQTPNLIATESVFSMEGDIAPIQDLTHLAQQHSAALVIDDAHGIGVLGHKGKGIMEYSGLSHNEHTCLVIPLGKAFNAMGAIVAGHHDMIESILQFARSYCFSTALPPIICLAIQAALRVVQQETYRREQLQSNIQFFNQYAKSQSLKFISDNATPIKLLMVNSNQKALNLQRWLLQQGYFTSAIRPPTVPVNQARLRISLNTHHTHSHIEQLINLIIKGLNEC